MNLTILGAGYVGSQFGQRMKAKGQTIRILCRTKEALSKYPWADETLLWDGRLPQDTEALLMAVAPREGAGYKKTYYDNALLVHSAPYIMYLSSTSVYGDYQGQIVDEDTFLKPSSENNEILIATEKCFPPERTCIFRLGEITGPGRGPANRIVEGAIFSGDGLAFCNFSPLDLILEKLEKAYFKRLTGIFNIVENYHPTQKELYTEIALKKGVKIFWDHGPKSSLRGNKIVTSKYINI